nr:pumilio homolog 1-like [Ipomoea batatas]GMC98282.1 pumilio homolog 1-like [Ipomoea batatas]
MITDEYRRMRSAMGGSSDFGEELEVLLREQRRQVEEADNREGELSIFRSGSAPPTIKGSPPEAFGGGGDLNGVSEEEMRSNAAYVSYYYSNGNVNPRLPPPLLSKEDWRSAQRLQGGGGGSGTGSHVRLGGIGDRRKVSRVVETSQISMGMGFSGKNLEDGSEAQKDWGGNGLIGLPGLGLGSHQKSIAEIVQDDIIHTIPTSRHPSHPASHAVDAIIESPESQIDHFQTELSSLEALHSRANIPDVSSLPNIGSSASHTYASALGASLSRSSTPDPQRIARAPSPQIPPIGGGRESSADKISLNTSNSLHDASTYTLESADLVAGFSGLNLSVDNIVDDRNFPKPQVHQESGNNQDFLNVQNQQNHIRQFSHLNKSAVLHGGSFLKGHSTPTLNSAGRSPPSQYLNGHSPDSVFPGFSMNASQFEGSNLAYLSNNAGAFGLDSRAMGGGMPSGPKSLGAGEELQNLYRHRNQNIGSSLQKPFLDPLYLQYLQSTEYGAAQLRALNDPAVNNGSLCDVYMDLLELQKASLGKLIASQKSQYGLPCFSKADSLNHGYFHGPGSPMASPILPNSPYGPGSPVRYAERDLHFSSGMRSFANCIPGAWHSDLLSNLGGSFTSSLIDEFKHNKAKCFELSEIDGHVVEFSADQYGSRFIQQKLETATIEEKNMVFHEIMPHALSLMTDVFGNYVIQKFFEHGSASQIRELADQLDGQVLTLSLQMYGCRVIQKALEVVDLDQKTKMVIELDGHIMRCVRDQNGNHVIQKCIECVPEEAIQFIVTTFYDQVVMLSTHPYGCRVIQRVLEHCHSAKTQSIVMNEILQSVCMLAQDQYGNYVIQHVLEHGKPDERSAIICQLIGQIVHMSQQKFASNVVEKCLTFGTPEERQSLVNEMLGSNDENEPLQAMMKDQFANYVVQKVLETCDDQQLELILNRIKVHLNALKKYTYGKHIVARVEKLVAAGERRIMILSSNSAQM